MDLTTRQARHRAALASKNTGLNDLFKQICASAMQRGLGEKEALEFAVQEIERAIKT